MLVRPIPASPARQSSRDKNGTKPGSIARFDNHGISAASPASVPPRPRPRRAGIGSFLESTRPAVRQKSRVSQSALHSFPRPARSHFPYEHTRRVMTQKRRTFKKSRHTSRSATTGEHTGPPPACIAFAASVVAPSIGKDASKVPSPNSLAFSRALASPASPASAITTILPSSLRLAPFHVDVVDTPPRAKSSLVDARTPRTTDRHARVRGRDPSSSTRSSRARVCVPGGVAPFPRARRGRSPPPARALFPTSRALYRTFSHNLPRRACTFCARSFLERVSGEIHESRLVITHARGCAYPRVWGVREGLPARPSDCLRTPVCRAARGGGRVVVGRRFVWDAREGWTREARRRRAWDGGGRYIVSREVRVKCVCARARERG